MKTYHVFIASSLSFQKERDLMESIPELRATVTNKINKLKNFQPEAFYYWAQISELLEEK